MTIETTITGLKRAKAVCDEANRVPMAKREMFAMVERRHSYSSLLHGAALRQAEDVPDQLLVHLSPLGWEHVNLTGDYIWSAERWATENRDGFRPLRVAPDTRKAA